jgi:ribosome biogenesis GTPase
VTDSTPSPRERVRDTTTPAGRGALERAVSRLDLADLGWGRAIRSAPAELLAEHPDARPARVLRVDRGRRLLVATGGAPPRQVHDRTRDADDGDAAAVGDWVLLEATDSAGGDDVAVVRLPRLGVLARRSTTGTSTSQVLAANVDLVLVAETLDPGRAVNAGRVARIAALATGGDEHVAVHVVLTGVDRVDAAQPGIVAGLPATCTSILDGRGLDELRTLLARGTTATIVGASGAGKSSLANALADADLLAVGERRDSGTGRHTTSVSRLVPLPGGALLVDTPGIRVIGMHADVDVESLAPDAVTELAGRCRFGDCRHEAEPGCAVVEAIERGELDPGSIATWRKLEREALRERARVDARLRRELHDQRMSTTRAHVKARRRGDIVERRR